MKITLIYPGISMAGFGCFAVNESPECNFMHHGIASLEAYLRKFGHNVTYLDLRQLKGWDDFKDKISEMDSVIYGISSTTVDFEYTIKCAELIKSVNEKAVVVVGGVHPTVCTDDAERVSFFDYIVTSEGEKALLRIIEGVENGLELPRVIKGEPVSLEDIPRIDRELFSCRTGEMMHPFVPILPIPSFSVMTSRGCPFNCSFCQPAERAVSGGKVRFRQMPDVIDELVQLKRSYGMASFTILDDLFLVNKNRIDEFVDLYKKSGVTAKFVCQGRADLIIRYEKELADLKEIGLIGIQIGFESGSNRILDFLNKGCTVEQNLQAARICKRLGITIWANYMLGIPTETFSEMLATVRMIARIDPEYYSPALFTPYPQTTLYDYCKENGLLKMTSYSQYRRSIGEAGKVKNVNYFMARLLIFLYQPFRLKLIYMKAFLGKLLRFKVR